MKFFAVLATILAVGAAYPSVWTIQQISDALADPHTESYQIPILEAALNDLMHDLHQGGSVSAILLPLPAPVELSPTVSYIWSLQELSAALVDPHTNPAVIPYLEAALDKLMEAIYAGEQILSIAVEMPADIAIAPVAVVPEAVIPGPVSPGPKPPTPGGKPPKPVPAPAVSSPLVQVIVNVNNKHQATHVIDPMARN